MRAIQAPSTAGPLRRLFSLSRRHRRVFGVATVSAVISVACGLAVPVFTQRLIDQGIVGEQPGRIWPLSLAALGFGLIQALTIFVRRNLGHRASITIEAELRSRLFAHLQGLPVSFHDRWPHGQLLARTTSDLRSVSGFFGNALVFLTSYTITFVGVAIVLFLLDAVLAAVVVALVVPFVLFARRFDRRMRSITRRSGEAVGDVTDVFDESIRGMRVLRGLGREDRISTEVERAAGALRGVNLHAVAIRSRHLPVLTLVPAVIVATVLGLGGLHVIDGSLSLGSLVAFNQYLALVLSPLRVAGWHLASAQQAAASGQRILEVLDIEADISDRPEAQTLSSIKGMITFDHVEVAYPDSSAPALHDVTFTVHPGETIAVVGPSGSGKSTLLALLLRFVDPTSGRVLVDGVDIKEVSLASLRQQVGTVFDDATLLRGTVRDNIAFADPDADEEALRRAAALAAVDGFVSDLPEGYETAVGDRGFSLSGGQRQRLALARAILSDPRILVLDDALSSVDVTTASDIEAGLRTDLDACTTFVTTCRASTAAQADQVILLEGGRVTAVGHHQELLAHPAYLRVITTEQRNDDVVGTAGRVW